MNRRNTPIRVGKSEAAVAPEPSGPSVAPRPGGSGMEVDLDMKAVDDMALETTTDQDMKADETSDEDEEGAKRPKLGEGLWGFGPPLGAQGHGQVKRR
eukprot:9667767-Heterocapsa_arctica.AAC.1